MTREPGLSAHRGGRNLMVWCTGKKVLECITDVVLYEYTDSVYIVPQSVV